MGFCVVVGGEGDGFWGALGQWCLVCSQRAFCLPWNFTDTNSPVCVLVCECLFGTDTQRHHGPTAVCGQRNKISVDCRVRHTYINLCLREFWQKVHCPHVALSLHDMLAHVVRLRWEVRLRRTSPVCRHTLASYGPRSLRSSLYLLFTVFIYVSLWIVESCCRSWLWTADEPWMGRCCCTWSFFKVVFVGPW